MLGDIDTIHIASQASMTRPMPILTTTEHVSGSFARMSLPGTPTSPGTPTNPLSRTSSASMNPSSPSFSNSFIGSFSSSFTSTSFNPAVCSAPNSSPIQEWHAKGKVPAIIRTLSKGLDPFR